MTTKIFVRERRKIEKGEKRPRFRFVGVGGSDVKIYVKHMRKSELDQISSETGTQIVYMTSPKGQKSGGGQKA